MQTPAPVDYERATSIAHALELMQRLGPEARVIAGGHSLLPMMRLRLAQPEAVIDINDLSELAGIRVEDNHRSRGPRGEPRRPRVGTRTLVRQGRP